MKRRITTWLLTITMLVTLFTLPVPEGKANQPYRTAKADDSGSEATFTLSVEAFSVGLGYLVEPVKIPLEEGKTTAYYVDKVLSQNSLTHNGGDPTNEFFYLSSIRGDALTGFISLPGVLKDRLEAESIPYTEGRSDDSSLSAMDVTSTSGWISTTNNTIADKGMGQEIPSAGDVIRLQFSVVDYGVDLGAEENEWVRPYFGVVNKDALTDTLAELLSRPDRNTLLQDEGLNSLYLEALRIIQQIQVSQAEVDRIRQALFASITSTLPPLEELAAPWKNYRGSDDNMAIRNSLTPTSHNGTGLKWTSKLGSDWTDCPSAFLLIEDSLVTMSGNALYQLDLETGRVKQSATMLGKPSTGAHIPPIYANGMIVAALDGGVLQAFDAKTLAPLWSYTDPLGGQALSHIAHSNGYLYTGFWNSDTEEANFVCLSAQRETNTPPVWTYTHKGGFYWTGAVVVGGAVIVGSDSGSAFKDGNETSHLYAFNKHTGEVISDMDGIIGDQRSATSYDADTGSLYFTTKAGYLYSAKVDALTGEITGLKEYHLGNGLQSTSTPVVYKGRVYFGLSDRTLTVSDAITLAPIYKVSMKGYPQGSFLLSTAYEEDNGYLYLYGTYNNKPGGVTMIRTKSDATSNAEILLEEIYLAEGYEDYCVDSVVCGTDGTLYYKNDSCNIFAIAKRETTDAIDPTPDPSPQTTQAPVDLASTPTPPMISNTPKPSANKPSAPKSIRIRKKKNPKKKTHTLALSWKRVKNVKGYEVYFSKRKNGKYKRAKTTTKPTYTRKNCKKGSYYFKIRSYRMENKKRIFSPFSKKAYAIIK